MEPIKIKATPDTPKIECNIDGTIILEGKSLTEDPRTFFKPIIEWVANLTATSIVFSIRLDYMNTSCSKEIYNLLLTAKSNAHKQSLVINWYCDSTDEDNLDMGKEFESMLEIPFNIQQF